MKRGAYFINTARGPMVDYDALYEALRSGHMRGAMLETFWQEPPPADAPLLKLPNVTLTPHIAGASLKTVRHAAAHDRRRGRPLSARRAVRQPLLTARPQMDDQETRAAPRHHRSRAPDERDRPEPGHLGQHQRALRAIAC